MLTDQNHNIPPYSLLYNYLNKEDDGNADDDNQDSGFFASDECMSIQQQYLFKQLEHSKDSSLH